MPLRRTLRFPRPKDPAGMRLISVQLRINETCDIVLVILRQARHRARVFAITAAHGAGAGKGAIVAGALAEPVEPFGAVGLRARPFADDGPFVGAGELWAQSAGGGDVFAGGHGVLFGGEDLVLVGVEDDVLVARGGVELAVPVGFEVLEGVVDAGCVVGAGGGDGFVAGLVEGFDAVEVERAAEGFVEEFDGGDDVGVAGVAGGEVLEGRQGLGDGVALLPVDGAVAAGVVEAVLATGS